jgi:hypothetical protein
MDDWMNDWTDGWLLGCVGGGWKEGRERMEADVWSRSRRVAAVRKIEFGHAPLNK